MGRGHEVVAVARNLDALAEKQVQTRELDLTNGQAFGSVFDDVELVIAAIGGRAQGNHDMVPATAQRLLEALANTQVQRLLWVGGAGSLHVSPGVELMSVEGFPAEYLDEARAQSQALKVFRDSKTGQSWTYVSPAAEIFPGDKLGAYRIGGEDLLQDAEGNSRISVQDYATAMLDEAEKGAHLNQRMGIAY